MVEHEELEASVAAYVLGATPPEEEREIAAHMESCASCRELGSRLSLSVAALALAADEVRPPARLRDTILTAVSGEPHRTGAPAGTSRPVIRLRNRRFRWPALRLSAYPAAVGALAIAVIGLGVWNVGMTRQLQAARDQARAAAAARFSLSGSGAMATASANVVYLKQDQVAFVDFRNMPALQPGKVYELWLGTPSGSMVPATVFKPDTDGSKVLVLTRSMRGYTAMAVTVENGPQGAQQPSESPQMIGKLA